MFLRPPVPHCKVEYGLQACDCGLALLQGMKNLLRNWTRRAWKILFLYNEIKCMGASTQHYSCNERQETERWATDHPPSRESTS